MFELVGELIIHYVEQGPLDAPVLLMLRAAVEQREDIGGPRYDPKTIRELEEKPWL